MSEEVKARILKQLGRDEESYESAYGDDEDGASSLGPSFTPTERTERKSGDWVSQVLADLRAIVETLKQQSTPRGTPGWKPQISQAVFLRALEHLNALERRIASIEKAGTVARGLFDEAKRYARELAERVE